MPELKNQHPLIARLVKILMDNDFSEDEAVAILKAIHCEKPEDMPKTCGAVIAWACATKRMSGLLDLVLKTSGWAEGGRSLVALSCEDGEVAFAFDPSIVPTKIKIEGGKDDHAK